MDLDSDYLIVYGTLRPHFSNPFASYLRQYSQLAGEGSFRGQLFDLGNYPGAIYQSSSSTIVLGTIYNISQHKRILIHYLDEYEGFGEAFTQPNEYVRTIIPVDCGGNVINCWFYLYNWLITGKRIIPSGDYISPV